MAADGDDERVYRAGILDMHIASFRMGLILAALNVLVFFVMLVTRETDYARLNELDACYRGGSSCVETSAEPDYIAGRPFYSPAHYANVSRIERFYFIANAPAILGAFFIDNGVFELRYWLEIEGLSLVQHSWLLAICIMTLGALWAFLVGTAGHRLVRWLRARKGTAAA